MEFLERHSGRTHRCSILRASRRDQRGARSRGMVWLFRTTSKARYTDLLSRGGFGGCLQPLQGRILHLLEERVRPFVQQERFFSNLFDLDWARRTSHLGEESTVLFSW